MLDIRAGITIVLVLLAIVVCFIVICFVDPKVKNKTHKYFEGMVPFLEVDGSLWPYAKPFLMIGFGIIIALVGIFG